jgi:cupin 2 domain-containing protein
MASPNIGNLFQLPNPLPPEELFTPLLERENVRIERIVSKGHTTLPGHWYDQDQDEWVIVLQGNATLTYENGHQLAMKTGDYVLIPAHTRHRVAFTSREPPCIWLAVHIMNIGESTESR